MEPKIRSECIALATLKLKVASAIINNEGGIRDSILKAYSDLAGVVYHGNNSQIIEANQSSFKELAGDVVVDTIGVTLNQLDLSKLEFGSDIQRLITDRDNGIIPTLNKHGIKVNQKDLITINSLTDALRNYSSMVISEVPKGADVVTKEAEEYKNMMDAEAEKFIQTGEIGDDANTGNGDTQTQPDQPEIQLGEPEIQLGEPEIQLGEPEIQLGEPEIQLGEPEDPIEIEIETQPEPEQTQPAQPAQPETQPEIQPEPEKPKLDPSMEPTAMPKPQPRKEPDNTGDGCNISTADLISDKERLEKVKNGTWQNLIDSAVNNVMKVYESLYSSCYSGVGPPVGALTNVGVIRGYYDGKAIAKDDRTDTTSTAIIYSILMSSMKEAWGIPGLTPLMGSSFKGNELLTTPDMAPNAKPESFVFYNLHLRAMFGYYRMCKGLKKIAEDNNALVINSDGTVSGRAKNFTIMRKYLREELSNIYYNEIIKNNLDRVTDPYDIDNARNQVLAIVTRINRALKNIIFISKNKNNVLTEIKFCIDCNLGGNKQRNLSEAVDALLNVLNREDKIMALGAVARKSVIQNDVVTIRLIYDEEKSNDASLFAYEALDGIIDSGQTPSWSHALLGELENGSPLFWDFTPEEVAKKAYCIYAESRAGKGVMTSTLITNVLANGFPLFYMDGKPENGAGLAKIAWKQGLEAPVWNGFSAKLAPYDHNLEEYSRSANGEFVRNPSLIWGSHQKIPAGIFKEDSSKAFMMLCTYIRGLEFMAYMIKKRGGEGHDSKRDNMVFIFDEMTKVTDQERTIRDIFSSYLASLGGSISKQFEVNFPNAKKGNENDEGVRFIKEWLAWEKNLMSLVVEAATMGLGKSASTLFFIFQGSAWMNDPKYKDCMIPCILKNINTTKIIGRRGVSGKGADSQYGDGIAAKYSWVQRVNNRSLWAITLTPSVKDAGSEESVRVFKPYNIYLEYDPSRSNGKEPVKETFLEGYLEKMFKSLSIAATPAQVLDNSYKIFNKAVVELGLAPSINDFMYNAHDFKIIEQATGDFTGITGSNGNSEEQPSFGNESIYDRETTGNQQIQPPSYSSVGSSNDTPVDFGSPEQELANNQRADEVQAQQNYQGGQTQPAQPDRQDTQQGSVDDWINQSTRPQKNRMNNPENDLNGADNFTGFGNVFSEVAKIQASRFNKNNQNDTSTPQQDQPINPVNNQNNDGINYDYVENQKQYANPQPEITNSNRGSCFDTISGMYSFKTNSALAQVMKLDDNNAVRVWPPERRFRVSKMLMKTDFGQTIDFNNRWKTILKEVAKSQGRQTVTKVIIANDALVFNNRQVWAAGMIGGPDGVEVSDVVNFRETAKMFPNIKQLSIDLNCLASFKYEVKSQNTYDLFKVFPRLMVVTLRNNMNQTKDIYRDTYDQMVQSMDQRETLRQKIDIISDVKNPNIGNVSNLEKHRHLKKLQNMTGNGWESCKRSAKSNKGMKKFTSVGYGLLAASGTVLVLGGGAITSVFDVFSKRK